MFTPINTRISIGFILIFYKRSKNYKIWRGPWNILGTAPKPALQAVDFTISSASIGVELEMVVTNLPSNTDHFALFSEAFKPLTSSLYPAQSFPAESPFQLKDDFSIIPTPRHPPSRRLEIATPIMTAFPPSSSTLSYSTLLPAMCRTITAALPPAASLEFNHTTALQVHIGVGAGNTYTLRDLKRLCKAIVLLEPHMDALHPRCRSPADNASPNLLRRCCASFKLRLLSGPRRLEAIDQQRSAAGLTILMNSCVGMAELPKCYRYNLRALEKFGTVEFRQAVGTVRSEVVVGWVARVLGFVEAAVGTADEVYRVWAEGCVGGEVLARFGVEAVGDMGDVEAWWGVGDGATVGE